MQTSEYTNEQESILVGIKTMVAHARAKCFRSLNDFDVVIGPALYDRLRVEMHERGYIEDGQVEAHFINVLTANGVTKVFKRQE